MTITAAVLGRPIAHSKSPLLHRAAFAALDLDGEYLRFDVGAEGLESFLSAHPDFTGFSLTMPLKDRLVELARHFDWELDDTAALTGAGNTLVRRESSTLVANTDVQGIVAALGAPLATARESVGRPAGDSAAGARTAVILGAGATARSAAVACARLGITEVQFLVRNHDRAQNAVSLCADLGLRASTGPLTELTPAELLISTLPAEATPDLRWSPQIRGGVALDVAYAASSAFLATATRHGVTPVSGTAMLVGQAVEQFMMFLAAAGDPAGAEVRRRVAAAMHAALESADPPAGSGGPSTSEPAGPGTGSVGS